MRQIPSVLTGPGDALRAGGILGALLLASLPFGTRAEEVLKSLSAPDATMTATGAAGGKRVVLTTVERPPITRLAWAIKGQVRTRDVEGQGFLEMWSVFPDGSRYFSRTLDGSGPMGHLSGTAERRPFVLPFFSQEGIPAPAMLELAVVFPGGGEVELSALTLVQLSPGESPMAVAGTWFSEQTAGLVGGLFGGLLGCVGALIGWLASRGKARAFVLALARGTVFLGALLLVAGAVSFLGGQPPAVWGTFALVGVLAALIMGTNLKTIRKRYEEHELRRMRSLDTM